MTIAKLSFIVLLLGSGVWPIPSSAQVHGNGERAIAFADKWAVVIGDGDFQNPEWNLKYAKNDAVDFRDYLVHKATFAPDHVKVLLDKSVSKDNILESFEWLGKVAGPQDLVLVYVRTRGIFADRSAQFREFLGAHDTAPAGVGACEWNTKGGLELRTIKGRNFLATYNTNPETMDANGLDMFSFVDNLLKKINAGIMVVVVDADFSGVMFRINHPAYIQSITHRMPFFMICSTGDNEISWESDKLQNSVFTHSLIEGLVRNGKSALFLTTANTFVVEDVKREVVGIKPNRSQHVQTMGINLDQSDDVMLAFPSTHTAAKRSQENYFVQ
jgi:uncharacterized caspase-like protein